MPKTKIIATLGPASIAPSILRNMISAGMDVARLNFSHGSIRDKLRAIETIRRLNRTSRHRIRILGDLEGYRIRIGALSAPITLRRNEKIVLVQGVCVGGARVVPFDYSGNLADIRNGQEIYIDDGNLCLKVEARKANALVTRVVIGGLLSAHKGVNIPAARLKFSGITDKDAANIRFCLAQNLDFIAQSFVRTAYDMHCVKALLGSHRPRLIAKIENRQGVRNLCDIMCACDGIMIARGDLGVSVPIYEVPLLQKEIIKICARRGKFSITATQMLESMIEHRRPTRAEVSDVANAIIDGSDYVMLSAETAVGRYPVESVRMMRQVVAFTQRYRNSSLTRQCGRSDD